MNYKIEAQIRCTIGGFDVYYDNQKVAFLTTREAAQKFIDDVLPTLEVN